MADFQGQLNELPPGIRYSLPSWFEDELRNANLCSEEHLTWMRNPAPISMRVVGKRPVGEMLAVLEKYSPKTDTRFPGALIFPSASPPYESPEFSRGEIQPQDLASQAIVDILQPEKAQRLLEVGAGLGVKTRQILERLPETATAVAVDLSSSRLKLLKRSTEDRRLQVREMDALEPMDFDEACFDAILLDAPCSGLGTVRRHPEILWWRKPVDIENNVETQKAMLENVSRHLSVGGVMVYAVCSLLLDEGRKVVEAFVDRNQNFAVLPVSSKLDSAEPPFFVSSPLSHNADYFFAALITRKE